MTKRRAVFLDRDGVLNRSDVVGGKPFAPRTLDGFALLPGVVEAVTLLKDAGFVLVVVTNQPDVGNGIVEQNIIEEMHKVMLQSLPLDRVLACYHTQQDNCTCRKPATGMIDQAVEEFDIDPASSFMVGDRWKDIAAGKAAGCTTVLIDYGYSEPMMAEPDYVVSSTLEAARCILGLETYKQ